MSKCHSRAKIILHLEIPKIHDFTLLPCNFYNKNHDLLRNFTAVYLGSQAVIIKIRSHPIIVPNRRLKKI